MMAGRRAFSLLRYSTSQASGASKPIDEGRGRSLGRKAVSTVLICLTGGVALSAFDDLAIYQGCSRKAMEKVHENQAVIEAIGEPIVKGPWYDASLAVARKRNSVSCSFPISGSQGTGMLHMKAIRNGEDSWWAFFRPREFDILIMDALLHIPSNEGKEQTIKINISDNLSSPPACHSCIRSPEQTQQ